MGTGITRKAGIKLQPGKGNQSYVVLGATTECSFGSMKSKLVTPTGHGVFINNKAQLNIMDFTPMINIMPFGLCSSLANPAVAAATAANCGVLTKMPCIPVVVTPWLGGKMDKLLENFPALLNDSTNMCTFCGRITITDDGQ